MANTSPTPVNFFRAAWLCALILFAPERFRTEEEADNIKLNASSSGAEPGCPLSRVRHAFFYSAAMVFLSGAFGYLCGIVLGVSVCATPKLIAWLQVIGACVLLWGTLFVRGWDIQTWGGVSLTERVNQWLYRSLYCFGTAILVCSLAWPQCFA